MRTLRSLLHNTARKLAQSNDKVAPARTKTSTQKPDAIAEKATGKPGASPSEVAPAAMVKEFPQFAMNQNLADLIRAAHGGAGLAHITKGRFEESELLQPGPVEQRRTVAEIEKQFTRLEAGVALRRVQANLERCRAAVLKAACEGRLVPTKAELQESAGRGQRSEVESEI